MPSARVIAEEPELFRRAAAEVTRLAVEGVAKRGRFTLALSGGTTPQGLYAALASDATAREAVPWSKTLVFWGDERQVPPEHPDSNYRMARETLLAKVPLPQANVHRVPGELSDAREAAQRYEDDIRAALRLAPGEMPKLDLILLGIGADGHTASLFPGTEAVGEENRIAVANWIDTLRAWRITLTVPAINRARTVLFLVCGEDKAAVVKSVLEAGDGAEPLPASLVRPRAGRVLWFLDPAAAKLLDGKSRGPRRRGKPAPLT